jgi:predicted ribosomally synthesized peptide with SipW-like signal peptide
VEEVKKILGLSIAIVLVIGLVAGGTWAYFSDTETITGNSFTAGTIDLKAGSPIITIPDIKPCMDDIWGYVRFHNVGDNEGNVWLHFANVMGLENGIVDPEAEAYWANSNYSPDKLRYDNFLECYTTIDVYVDPTLDGKRDGGTLIIDETLDWKLSELECQWIPLGSLGVGEKIEVWVSFHIQPEAGNEFQSDQVQFDIEAMLQQTAADPPTPEWPNNNVRVLRLENKDSSQATPTSAADMVGNEYWTPILGDGIYGILTYDPVASNFKYTFEAYGLTPGGNYSLIYYADPWKGGNPGALIATFTADASGDIAPTSGSIDLAMDLPHTSDANYPGGAKIWLVTTSDYDSTNTEMSAWNPNDYLFEMRLITYNDTDV